MMLSSCGHVAEWKPAPSRGADRAGETSTATVTKARTTVPAPLLLLAIAIVGEVRWVWTQCGVS